MNGNGRSEILIHERLQLLEHRLRKAESAIKALQVSDSRWAQLTKREQEVAVMAIDGKPNNEIAHDLHISPQTVKNHMTKILEKTAATNRTELARLAFRNGWIE